MRITRRRAARRVMALVFCLFLTMPVAFLGSDSRSHSGSEVISKEYGPAGAFGRRLIGVRNKDLPRGRRGLFSNRRGSATADAKEVRVRADDFAAGKEGVGVGDGRIDESLYSRQLFVMGMRAQQR